ncbi:MAG: RIP metalloprotease RseP [Odoribacter sp.]
MDILIKVLQLVLSLSILVVFHEFGHFLFAKLFKTRVEKFYMFFNPWFSLFKFKKGETEYGVGWLPLGGYVKIAGMIDESMDTEQMKQPAQAWEFRAKPAWQRLLIMLGGVMVNVLLAFAIYIGILYTWGETYLPAKNVTYGVVCDSIFTEMGMQKGDQIIALDHQELDRFGSIIPEMLLNHPKTMQVIRQGEKVSLDIPDTFVAELLEMSSKSYTLNPLLVPRHPLKNVEIGDFADYSVAYDAGIRKGDKILSVNDSTFRFYDEFTELVEANKGKEISTHILRGTDTLLYNFTLSQDGKFGIYVVLPPTTLKLITREYTLLEAIPAGIKMGVNQLGSYVKQLKLLFSQGSTAVKSVGGFASIANIFPTVWNWADFWSLTALISIMLAVVNILPIPALDGGHVLFLLYEVITRRRPGEKFMEYAQIVGMVFIFGLFILANVNDVIKFFG